MAFQNIQAMENLHFFEIAEAKDAVAYVRPRAPPGTWSSVSTAASSDASSTPTASVAGDACESPAEEVATNYLRPRAPPGTWSSVSTAASSDASSEMTSTTEGPCESPSEEVAGGTACSKKEDKRTTLMLRNVPNDYNRDMFLNMLDRECLAGLYDFVYLPMDFQTGSGLGYAFVNFTSHEDAVRAWQVLDAYENWGLGTTKVCEVRWSSPVQGLSANVKRYRNSPMMHHRVPDIYKPAVFSNGVRIEYPAPKKPLKYMPAKKPANQESKRRM